MNHKHSELFHISPKLFDNRRLKRRRSKWMERLRERQRIYMALQEMGPSTSHTIHKTDRSWQRCQLMLPRRRVAAAMPVAATIDLLSDDDDVAVAMAPATKQQQQQQQHHQQQQQQPATTVTNNLYVHPPGSLQLSMVPNITLVPVPYAPAHNSNMLLMPATENSMNMADGKRQRKAPKPRKRHGQVTATSKPMARPMLVGSIVLTSDDEDNDDIATTGGGIFSAVTLTPKRLTTRSPPPLAPLTLSETVEEVTVSLVPRNATTANCHARRQRYRQPTRRAHSPNACSAPTSTTTANGDGYLDVDVGSSISATLPDETTVHTVIANRIYELSLSKLREGLASSGAPEYDMLPEQLQKLSPALRAKVAPMMLPSPPVPISLKLSSDLSISLISDDDECESSHLGGGSGHEISHELVHPVVAAEAHAAAKLLKQQQPQLSVVQHLQYAGRGAPIALALPVVAHAAAAAAMPTTSTRRRKLG